jgi:hypothetical protein
VKSLHCVSQLHLTTSLTIFAGTLFLELWKRYSADITHRWGLLGFDLQAEHPRPEYLAKLRDAKYKINFVTQVEEPYVPFWKVRVPATILSFSVVLLLVLGTLFYVVLYNILTEFGIPMKLVRLIKTCLNGTCSKVHVGKNLSDGFSIRMY